MKKKFPSLLRIGPAVAFALGAAAARLAHAGHTWAHRARALRDALGRRLG